ncbi:hypothetical protein FHW84_002819 [Dyella sp. SG562]|uniref:hypothetical protein n=1 Tax=Dyella sp. SG562 TaxID=2587017 RepID=UPI00141E845F|nr:hypothetical protein [Dyella sp. SG562]NII74234.1 hypothetical protein [Dyella sp. SG562]
MGQITLDFEDAQKIINNPDAGGDARVIAAFTIAFFVAMAHAHTIEPTTTAIALKLAHKSADAIYRGVE